uniref:Methyltransferase n=1 Tax=viral metagenome TaxID=1070528 RepID=A0A6C0DJL9_9ZZZZ
MTDKFCIPNEYRINANPEHYIDLDAKDEWQKEVYIYAKEFAENNSLTNIVDVGCGSGYKLIKYLGNLNTTGIETEPCFSFLKIRYPERKWLNSGESEVSFKSYNIKTDIVICSDVIEHIVDPNNLVDFLLSIDTKYYILSTPCRDILVKHPFNYNPLGPPKNKCHVREWTMGEFKKYISEKFTIVLSQYAKDQRECQFHLLIKKVNA